MVAAVPTMTGEVPDGALLDTGYRSEATSRATPGAGTALPDRGGPRGDKGRAGRGAPSRRACIDSSGCPGHVGAMRRGRRTGSGPSRRAKRRGGSGAVSYVAGGRCGASGTGWQPPAPCAASSRSGWYQHDAAGWRRVTRPARRTRRFLERTSSAAPALLAAACRWRVPRTRHARVLPRPKTQSWVGLLAERMRFDRPRTALASGRGQLALLLDLRGEKLDLVPHLGVAGLESGGGAVLAQRIRRPSRAGCRGRPASCGRRRCQVPAPRPARRAAAHPPAAACAGSRAPGSDGAAASGDRPGGRLDRCRSSRRSARAT